MANNLLPDVEPRQRRGSLVTPEDVAAEAERQGFDPFLAVAVAKQESRGQTDAVSPKGARGVMQIMPATRARIARQMGEPNRPGDVQQDVRFGVFELKRLAKKFGGDYDKTLEGYNAGEGRVAQYPNGVPFKETRDYRRKIRSSYEQLAASLPEPKTLPQAKPPAPKAVAPVAPPASTDGTVEISSELPTITSSVKKVALPDVPRMAKSLPEKLATPASKPKATQVITPSSQPLSTVANLLPEIEPTRAATDVKILSPEETRASKKQEADAPFVLQQTVSAKDGVRQSSTKQTPNMFQAQEVRAIDRTAGVPEPDPRASEQSLALRFSEQQSRQFAKASPERKQQMILGSYVNNLPAEDRDAASRAIQRLRSYAPDEFDRAISEQNSMREVDPRVATWAKPGDKELTLSVDSMIPELIQAYKQGGAVAFDSLYRMRNEERAQFGREREQQMQARQAQVEAVKQDFGQRDASGSGKAKALGTIAASALADSVLGVVGGAADLTGALAGKFGLDALDRRLTNFADTEAAKQEAIRRGQDQQQSQAELSNLSASGARLVGQLPVIAGSVMAGGGGGGGAASMYATSMLGSTREEPLKAMVNAYVDALSVGIGSGGEKTARALLSGASKEAAADIIVMTPDFAQIAALKAYAAQNPGRVSAAEMAEADKKLEKLTADALAAAIFAGAESASSARVLKRVYDKLATVDPTMTSSMSVLEATIEIGRRAMGRPGVQQAAQVATESDARVEELSAVIAEDTRRWKRGEVPVNPNAQVELQQVQVQAEAAEAALDEVVTQAMEAPTKDISALSDGQKLAALTTEQIKNGKKLTPIPAGATLDQAKEIYRQRVQDFGTDSVAAAEAWQKVRELSPEVQLQAGRDRFYALPEADALLSRLGNEIGSPKGLKEIDAFIRKNKIQGLTAEDIAGDYLTKEQAEQDDLKSEYEKMGLPTKGVVQADGLKAVSSQTTGVPDTSGRVIDLEADLEAERVRLAEEAEGKRQAEQQEAEQLAELERQANEKAAAKAQADGVEKIRLAELEKAEKEAQKLQAKQQEAQAQIDQKRALFEESQALIEQQRTQYTEALAQSDYGRATRSLKQIEAQIKFQLREKPTTPAEAAMVAEREADLEDLQAEIKRLQNLQKTDTDSGKPSKPSGPLFSDMARDPEFMAQQQHMTEVEADRKWLNLAEESKNRKLTDEEKVALKSPIEYLKHATKREGINVGTSGERALLGAKESGIVGLTNQASRFTTADAQVMLDEGGFVLPDGRRFIDPSVTENDVVDYLINNGKTAQSEMADVDQEQAEEMSAYYEQKAAEEAASRDINADYEQQDINAELAEFDQAGRLRDGDRSRDRSATADQQIAGDSAKDDDLRTAGTSVGLDDNGENAARRDNITAEKPEGQTSNDSQRFSVAEPPTDADMDEMAGAMDRPLTPEDARRILGEAAYKEYSERIDNADEEFNKLTDRIARGFETPAIERQFLASAKRAGFTEAEGYEILRRARQIAARSTESAKRNQERMDARRARGRRARWQAENQRLTETYGGQFVDAKGYDVNVQIFSRTGRNQVVIEFRNDNGDMFRRFTTSEHYLDAGLLGRMGLSAPARMDNLAQQPDEQLSRTVAELNQLLSHSFEELRAVRATDETARAENLNTVVIPQIQATLREGQAEMIRRGLLKSAAEEQRKAEGDFTKQALADQFYAELARKQAEINQAAHEAATSPMNDRPEPSNGQKEAGNYKKGMVRLHGLEISVENPQGSTRSGVDPDGKPWEVEMTSHYGYLRRTEGADGEQVDVYIGNDPSSERVFVVDQVHLEESGFDEHKVILNATDQATAEAIYDAHFSDGKGPQRRAAVTEMTLPEFKDWLKSGDTTKQVARVDEKSKVSASEATPNTPEPESAAKQDSDAPMSIVIEDFGEKIGNARKDVATPLGKRVKARAVVDSRPVWQRRYEIHEIVKSYRPNEVGKWGVSRDGKVYRDRVFDTKELAEAALPLIEAERKHRVRNIAKRDAAPNWAIYRIVADGKYPAVRDGFKSHEDAEAYLKAHPEKIIAHKFQEPQRPWLDSITRIGEERRQGDVDPKRFQQDFGFRGGEFGNWNKGGDGQAAINYAYDAMHDLAKVLGIDPQALSLGGQLSIAFGARGHGGKDAASAHYEPARAVINLTKIKGAGSLAHEWFHAVDHYTAQIDGKTAAERQPDGTFKLGKTEPMATHGFSWKSQAQKELADAFKDLVQTMTKRQVEMVTDVSDAQKTVDRQGKYVQESLDDIKSSFLYDASRYNKRYKAATPEQVKQFDELAAKIVAGEVGSKIYVKSERSRMGGYETYPVIQELDALFKAVQGRGILKTDYSAKGRVLGARVDEMFKARERVGQSLEGRGDVKTVGTEFFNNARELDSTRVSNYYTTPHEMGARAFESYIYDKLAGQGNRSDYLVYGVENKYYLEGKPYPEGAERELINAAFDRFFDMARKLNQESGYLSKAATEARQRLKESLKGDQMNDVTRLPQMTLDLAIVGAEYLYQGIKGAKAWARAMVAEFGPQVRPVLRKAWVEAKKFYSDERGMLNLHRVKQLLTPATRNVAVPATFDPVKFSAQIVSVVNSTKLTAAKKQAALDAYNAAMVAVGANDGAGLKKAQRELKRALGQSGLVLMDVFRPFMAGGELSIVGRQGGYHFIAHPVLSGKALGAMKSAYTERGYDTALASLENNPRYEQAKKMGVDFGVASEFEITRNVLTGEENFSLSLLDKIRHSRVPLAKTAAKALGSIEQMNKVFLDTQRMNVFAHGAEIIEQSGGTKEEVEAGLREWAKEVNRASGRGNIKEDYQQAVAVASVGLFSPRFAISRLQLLDLTRFYRAYKKNPKVAKMQIADAMKVLGAASALTGLAFLSGASIGDDPDDADFLKARWGDYHLNLLPSGLGTYVRFAARMVKRSVNYAQTQDQEEIKKAAKQLGQFARYKEAPMVSLVHDQLSQERDKGAWQTVGHNAIGESKTLRQSVLDRIWPMFYQNVVEAAQKEGIVGVLKTLPEGLGADAQLYQEREFIGRPPEPRSKSLSAPVERDARKAVYDQVSKTPAYAKLPDPFKAELMERQMSDAVNDLELKKPRSTEFKRLALQSDAAVVQGLQKLHELPVVKEMSFAQKKEADKAYYKSLQHLRGTRESADKKESLPELPVPMDLREALMAGVKAGKTAPPM
jgi:Inorganic Pyrophosphatase/Large polyvalent protein-associated domain 1/Transglycosylase SLT domain